MAKKSKTVRGEKPHLRQRSARGYELTYTNAAGVRDTETIRADTGTAARAKADKFLSHVEDTRLGIDEGFELRTLIDAFWEYAEVACLKRSWPQEFGRWKNHILGLHPATPGPHEEGILEVARPAAFWRARSRLAKKFVHKILSGDLEALYAAKRKEGLEPRTVRQLKAHLGRFFRWAIRKKKYRRGENPAWESELPFDIPEVVTRALNEVQLELLLNKGFEDFGTFFLLLFDSYTGLRRGELCGLLWGNVHEEKPHPYIWVAFSFADPTKGKRACAVPIHPILLPYVRYARSVATSEFVFPGQDGLMRPRWWDSGDAFRTCLVRAGLVKGWQEECRPRRGARTGLANHKAKLAPEQVRAIQKRAQAGDLPADIAKDFGVARQVVLYHARKAGTFRPPGGCGYKAKELAPEKSTGQCPKCGAPLWATAVPLDFTLKHLRSTFGSYVVESAGGLRAAQLFLRHRDHQTTDAHYAERRDPYLQAQMAQVRILPADRLPTAGGSFLSERARLSSTSSENQSQLPVLDHRGAQSP